MRQSLEHQIALLKVELLLKEDQLKLKEEQLNQKNERILYLERQLYGRRSEKMLPGLCKAQLSIFDSQQGTEHLEQETLGMTSLVEEITQKAEKRRKIKKEKAVSKKRSYKIPADIERRETIIIPQNVDTNGMIKIGEDVTERLMLDKAKFWVERTVRPIYIKERKKSKLPPRQLFKPHSKLVSFQDAWQANHY